MDLWTAPWWAWLILGLVLLGLEMAVPGGFYLVFFGTSALVVGVLAALGVVPQLWAQVLILTVLAVVGIALFRQSLVQWARVSVPHGEVDALVGETALALEDIAPDSVGKVELRGSPWNARNIGAEPLANGQSCRVVRVDGLTLWVRGAS
jgi:membrane protein implicated in regulation of membrane protease activity